MYNQKIRPRVVWLLGRKSQLTIFFGAGVQSEGAVELKPMPKTMVSMMGRLSRRYNSFRVMKKNSEKGKNGEKERERFGERSGSLGMKGISPA
jgi:hypothetical protein